MLRDCPESVAGDAILLTSELASNVVLHARTPFELEVIVDGCIRIVVRDRSSQEPVVHHPAPDELGGRGLLLVETLSDRWGFEANGHGKTVWFEIDP